MASQYLYVTTLTPFTIIVKTQPNIKLAWGFSLWSKSYAVR